MEPQRKNSTSVLRVASCIGAVVLSRLIFGRIRSQSRSTRTGKGGLAGRGDSNAAAKGDGSPRSSVSVDAVTAIAIQVPSSSSPSDTVKPRMSAEAPPCSIEKLGLGGAVMAESVKPERNQPDPAKDIAGDDGGCTTQDASPQQENNPNVASLVENLEKNLVQPNVRSVLPAVHGSSAQESFTPDSSSDDATQGNTSCSDHSKEGENGAAPPESIPPMDTLDSDLPEKADNSCIPPCALPPIQLKQTPKWALNINAMPFMPVQTQYPSLSREGTPRHAKLDPASKPFSPRSSGKIPSIQQMTFDPAAKPFTLSSSRMSNQLPPPPTPSTPQSAAESSQATSNTTSGTAQKPTTPRPNPVKTFASVAGANAEQQPKASSVPARGKRMSNKHNARPSLNPTAKPFTSAASKLNQQAAGQPGPKPGSPSTPDTPLPTSAGCPTPCDTPAQSASSSGPSWAALVRSSIQTSP